MQGCKTHSKHAHVHGSGCGHAAVKHEGHVDYLHDGHLHHGHADHWDEHVLAVSAENAEGCTPDHACSGHSGSVKGHGKDCGDLKVPHGGHVDCLVAGHLHHPHGKHCDDHGKVSL